MKFQQACVDATIKIFEKDFLKRWDLKPYYSMYEPAVFFGIWNTIPTINRHKSYRLIYLANPGEGEKLKFHLVDPYNTVIKTDMIFIDGQPSDIPSIYNTKRCEFEIKDYSIFQPNALGDKIYAYIGAPNRHDHFKLEKLKQLQRRLNYEIVYAESNHLLYFNYKKLKHTYYDNCFVNINLSQNEGMTTVHELANMGRYTIGNLPRTRGPLHSVINYIDEDHIVELVNNEAKKIGTVQPRINNHTVGDEWLNVDFWFENGCS